MRGLLGSNEFPGAVEREGERERKTVKIWKRATGGRVNIQAI